MDMVSQIANMSIGLSQMKVKQEVGVSVMKMAMDQAGGNAQDLMEMMQSVGKAMELSVQPNLGANIDIGV